MNPNRDLAGHCQFVQIDFARPDGFQQSLRFCNPTVEIAAWKHSEVLSAIAQAEQFALDGFYVAGWVAYEAAPAFDAAMHVTVCADQPLVWFGIFSDVEPSSARRAEDTFEIGDWSCEHSEHEHSDAVETIRSKIAEGTAYQVNLTTRFRSTFKGDPFALYESMCRGLGGKFSAYFEWENWAIASASPELFFHVSDGVVTTRPMKGTATRGRFPTEDICAQDALRRSPKDQAENVMIVDLLRSDLGKISKIGSVQTSELFHVEQFRTVHQMTSTVRATLNPDVGLPDLFRALFPCGSITGAPKISSMAIIQELEKSPRGVYCGAIGLIQPGGEAAFNVPIRTTIVDRKAGQLIFGSGAGITWDSRPDTEYAETLSKARIVTEQHPEFELLETILLENGDYTLLDRHLDRMLDSAGYFNIPLSEITVRDALDKVRADCHSGSFRVRLLANSSGTVRVEHTVLVPVAEPVMFTIAEEPVDSSDVFLFHKTTRRDVYRSRREARADAADVLLRNERGEITEFTNANVAIEIDGALYTPPVCCGLLAGTQRASMIQSGELKERVLREGDMSIARKILYLNSVRGALLARMLP